MELIFIIVKILAIAAAVYFGLSLMKQARYMKYRSKLGAMAAAFSGGIIIWLAYFWMIADWYVFRTISLWIVGIVFGVIVPLKYYFNK